jgi:hypothetical protein
MKQNRKFNLIRYIFYFYIEMEENTKKNYENEAIASRF